MAILDTLLPIAAGPLAGLVGQAQGQANPLDQFKTTEIKNTAPSAAMTQSLQDQVNQAQQTPEQLSAKSMEGTGQARGLLGNDQIQSARAAALGGPQDEGMMQAIKNRQNKVFDSSLSKLQRQADLMSPMQKFQMSMDAFKGLNSNQIMQHQQEIAQQEMQYKQFQQKFQVEQNRRAQQNNVLNSVLGLGGQIVGTALGGAAGGALGAQAGNFLTGGKTELQGI